MKKLLVIVSCLVASLAYAEPSDVLTDKTIGAVVESTEVDVLIDCKNRLIETPADALSDPNCKVDSQKRWRMVVELPSKERVEYLARVKRDVGFKLVVVRDDNGKWFVK